MPIENHEITPASRFEEIVTALHGYPGVTAPSGSAPLKKFGSSGLRVNNKVFAMISAKGEFVVKLPRERVNELVSAGVGEHFDPGHGRLMREWLAVDAASEERWLPLAREAMEFVASRR